MKLFKLCKLIAVDEEGKREEAVQCYMSRCFPEIPNHIYFQLVLEHHCVNVGVGDKRKPLLWEHLVYVKSKSEKRGKSKVSMAWSLFIAQYSKV